MGDSIEFVFQDQRSHVRKYQSLVEPGSTGPVIDVLTTFLSAGWNVIAVAYGTLSTDYYVRDGGDGTCLPDTSGNTFSADGSLEYAASGW